jgi:hypothetical protein
MVVEIANGAIVTAGDADVEAAANALPPSLFDIKIHYYCLKTFTYNNSNGAQKNTDRLPSMLRGIGQADCMYPLQVYLLYWMRQAIFIKFYT